MISVDTMVEVTLKQPDDFLKVKETLTRIGVASKKSNTLFLIDMGLAKRFVCPKTGQHIE